MWDEDLAPTLQPVPGLDVAHYLSALEMRFRNPRIRHRLLQIAMDGSQKLPPRLLMPAVDRLRCGAFPRRIALVVAGWMRFLLGADDVGRRYEISDPLASRLTEIAGTHGRDAEALVDTLLAVRDVFDPALAQVPGFRREVRAALGSLLSRGASATLVEALKEPSGGGGS